MTQWAVCVRYGPYCGTTFVDSEQDEIFFRHDAILFYQGNNLQRIYPLVNVISVTRFIEEDRGGK